MAQFNNVHNPSDLIRLNNSFAIKDGDKQIVHDDFLREIATLFFPNAEGVSLNLSVLWRVQDGRSERPF